MSQGTASMSQAMVEDNERRKREITRAIKPVSGITKLPPRDGPVQRVLLIVPPGTLEEHVGRLSGAAGELPMLGLAFIAASLRDQGHEVKVIDYEVLDRPMSDVAVDIQAFRPQVIGMTAYITNMRRCAAVASTAKQVDPGITVVLGGPQVTIFPDEAFNSPDVDVIVLSEGEIIVRNLMNALGDDNRMATVRGIWFRRQDGTVQRNEREVLVDQLDLFPRPAIDLFPMERYFPPVYIRGRKVAHLLTSRGCPFQCTFCETKLTFGRSFRWHSTVRVVEELESLIAQGYDSFQFYDDIFTANKGRVTELCQAIIDRGWSIQWMCYTRTNTVSAEMLALMKRAGCYMISYGIESADDHLLDIIKKNLSVADHRHGLALTKRAGIQIAATFMLGLPEETAEQTAKTIDFALENGVDYAIFGLTEPYPGTELWIDAQKYGRFDDSGLYKNNLLSEHAAVWIPHGREREELKQWVSKAMWRFYMRPQSILLGLRNFIHLPFGRAVRFFWAGVVFFGLGWLRRDQHSHRASRN